MKTPVSVSERAPHIEAGRLAALVELTPKWLAKLAARGCFPPAVDGHYETAATIRGLIRHYQDMAQAHRGTCADARRRKLAAEASLRELELAKATGEVVNREAGEAVIREIGLAMRRQVEVTGAPPDVQAKWLTILRRFDESINWNEIEKTPDIPDGADVRADVD